LEAQFWLNREDLNFLGSNLIFTKSIGSIKGKIIRKSKFFGQLRVKFAKGVKP
jgi:hypothetical protein